MNFSEALSALKSGHKVARSGWNGKGMLLFLVPGSRFKVNRPPLLGIYPEGTEIDYCSHVDMKTADGEGCPLVVQSDRYVGGRLGSGSKQSRLTGYKTGYRQKRLCRVARKAFKMEPARGIEPRTY